MEPAEYDNLDRLEDRIWWFAALHANLLMLARTFAPAAEPDRLLDAGCGTGGLLTKLAAERPATTIIGLDADETAVARAQAKSGRPVCRGSVNTLPFADASFSAIFSADVLCHREVDERQALRQFRRCLIPGGILVLNLPAYGWMLSRHDTAVHNVRRYTRGDAVRLLRDAGFRLLYSGYWNAVLFPVMVIIRKLLPGRGTTSDVKLHAAPIEALCRAAAAIERMLLARGLRLPFGGSLLAVADKFPETENAHA